MKVVEDFIHLVGGALKAFQSSLIVTDNLGKQLEGTGQINSFFGAWDKEWALGNDSLLQAQAFLVCWELHSRAEDDLQDVCSSPASILWLLGNISS